MKIINMKLKNWKNFPDIEANLSDRVFLIGANASGKSNFFDAILFMRDIVSDGLHKAVMKRGGMRGIRTFWGDETPPIMLYFQVDEWEYGLEIQEINDDVQPIIVSEYVKMKDKVLLQRPDEFDNEDKDRLTQTALEQVSVNKFFRDLVNFFKKISYQHILPQVVREPHNFISPAHTENDPYGRNIINTMWNLPEPERNARLECINEALRVAIPNFNGLRIVFDRSTNSPHLYASHDKWDRLNNEQVSLNIDAINNITTVHRKKILGISEAKFSDGTLRLLAMLWICLEHNGTILLEEPEISLHEEIVAQLPSIFASLIRNTQRQIIVSTHSKAMLSDIGIHGDEVLLLIPTENGTTIKTPENIDHELMQNGLSIANVLLPKTSPKGIHKLQMLPLL